MPRFYDAMPTDHIASGESTIVDVDGFPVAVANVEGEFYAFQSLCPHQGTKLGGRPVKDCVITCSQHSSAYDVRSGKCLVPASGDGFDQDLITFEVEVVEEVVRIRV